MILKTFGHATLAFFKENESPIVITDPWLYGSCYWRSWWLQNYPTENDYKFLKLSENILLTHEHWDHTHVPSLKKIYSKNQKLIIPNLNSKRLKYFLDENFEKVFEAKDAEWCNLTEELKYFSIPLYNDDSIVLFETKNFLIVNFNDAKPTQSILKYIQDYKLKINKKIIVLQSYAPASIVNSFRNLDSKVISIKSKNDYVNYVKKTCSSIHADYFIPFASQAIYSRHDSKWANEFKVNHNDLKNSWNIDTVLCEPYTEFNLNNCKYHCYVTNYNPSNGMNKIVNQISNRNNSINIDLNLINKFNEITNPVKFFLILLFPLGLNFKINDKFFKFNFLIGGFKSFKKTNFYFEIPYDEFVESVTNRHFTDTGTSFILKILVNNKNIDIYRSYLLFVFLTFSEKGYFSNLKMFFNQLRRVFSNIFFNKKIDF